jgi:hypothetical protein
MPLDNQEHGCDSHRYIPIMLEKFAVMEDVVDDNVVYKNTLTGNSFSNGKDFLSREIHACADKKALGDQSLKDFRKELGDNEVIG